MDIDKIKDVVKESDPTKGGGSDKEEVPSPIPNKAASYFASLELPEALYKKKSEGDSLKIEEIPEALYEKKSEGDSLKIEEIPEILYEEKSEDYFLRIEEIPVEICRGKTSHEDEV